MQVGFRDLTVWSFLMASAHGAGLMVLPFVLDMPAGVAVAHGAHGSQAAIAPAATAWTGALAAGVHTLAYFAVTVLTAWVVYRKIGLAILRTAWFNMDWFWAAALVVTGLVVLVM
jgi:hypothetical protein